MSVYLVLLVLFFRRAGADHAATMNALGLGLAPLAVGRRFRRSGWGRLARATSRRRLLGDLSRAFAARGRSRRPARGLRHDPVRRRRGGGLGTALARLRGLFPPAISGFIVLIVGLELG